MLEEVFNIFFRFFPSDHNSTSNLHGAKSQSRLHGGSAVSDLSNDSSPEQGFPDFPPSPDSWLGDTGNTTTSNPNSATPGGVHYWYSNILFRYFQMQSRNFFLANQQQNQSHQPDVTTHDLNDKSSLVPAAVVTLQKSEQNS